MPKIKATKISVLEKEKKKKLLNFKDTGDI